ncbi:MAG TPA: TIGR01777 family oxidoreductase [Bryobacteraceae bacterium]|nr:TIGR01777 family oxidoreductase [Bryobacteraceae bacterium]
MIVVITGASGFIGRHLTGKLREAGHVIREVKGRSLAGLPQAIPGADAVIHLAGENVAQRWTQAAKRRIRDSRINGTWQVVQSIQEANPKPAALLCASAVGIYGSRGDEALAEDSRPGLGFLANVCLEWEREARAAEAFVSRVVNLRFGAVLGRDGGAYSKMARPIRWGVGGRLGDGKQWLPWVHIDDVVGLIQFSLANSGIRGPINVTAPNPVTNGNFTNALAAAMHRPAIFAVPRLALKLMLGEMSEVVLASQRVLPQAALTAGYKFEFSEIGPALDALV